MKINGANVRLAAGGKQRTVYIEHGVFYDAETKHVHVTAGNSHWSYPRGTKEYDRYRDFLIQADRWPEDAPTE